VRGTRGNRSRFQYFFVLRSANQVQSRWPAGTLITELGKVRFVIWLGLSRQSNRQWSEVWPVIQAGARNIPVRSHASFYVFLE